MTNVPSASSVNAATSFPVDGMERDDVGADHARAVLGHAAADAAGGAPELLVAVDVRDAGDVVGAERAIEAAGGERDREHHRLGAEHAASTRDELRLPDHRMAEAEQVADLVERDRLDVLASRPRPPPTTDQEKVEFRKMSDSSDLARDRVDREGRGSEHAIEIRTVA